MDWIINRLKGFLTFIRINRSTIVLYNKMDPSQLEVCGAKSIRRERPFWRTGKIDLYHLKDDGEITHTPG